MTAINSISCARRGWFVACSAFLASAMFLGCSSGNGDSTAGGDMELAIAPEIDVPAADGYRFGTPSEEWREAIAEREAEVGIREDDTPFIVPIESFFFAQPETVCFPDERQRVKDTTVATWSPNCQLIITMRDGRRALGSGWLLGPRLVVTAGHCVHEGKDGNFYRSIEVIPAANGSLRPFGSQISSDFRAASAWRTSGSLAGDYGAIILSEPFEFDGKSPGLHTFAVLPDSVLRRGEGSVVGYPGDKPFATQWHDADPLALVGSDRLRYFADTYGGQSGGAVLHGGAAVGIHNYGGCPNYSTRITRNVERDLLQWLRESEK